MKAVLGSAIAVLFSFAASGAWAADTYPAKPVRIIVPFSPGGGSDTMARVIGAELTKSLGQSVVVENKPGAAGMVATAYVAGAAPDGYTLMLADVPFAANLAVYPKPSYRLEDFAAVATIATVPAIVVVGPQLPVATLADLVELSKKRPGELNMASGGTGGVAHLQGAQFAHVTGIEWAHIPYRGMGPAALDVIGGRADLMFASAPTVVSYVKEGRLKALAVTASKRSAVLPDIPTFAELGYPQLTADNWFGLVAPAKTPPEIIGKLHDKVNAALASPAVQEMLAAQMGTPFPSVTAADFQALIARDTQKWVRVVQATHITAN